MRSLFIDLRSTPPRYPIPPSEYVVVNTNSSSNEAPTEPKPNFVCNHFGCGQTFTRKSILEDHIRSKHLNLKPYQCRHDGCEKAFTRRNDLRRHQREQHQPSKWACGIDLEQGCRKEFSRAFTLKKHQESCDSWKSSRSRRSTQKSANVIATISASDMMMPQVRSSPIQLLGQQATSIKSPKPWRLAYETDPIQRWDFIVMCNICGVKKRPTQHSDELFSFLYHLLDHLENIETCAFNCTDCFERFPLPQLLERHREMCLERRFNPQDCGRTCDELEFRLANGERETWGCGAEFRLPKSPQGFVHPAVDGRGATECSSRKVLEELVKLARHDLGTYLPASIYIPFGRDEISAKVLRRRLVAVTLEPEERPQVFKKLTAASFESHSASDYVMVG